MSKEYFVDNDFLDKNFQGRDVIEKGDYEYCRFKNCNFSKTDLSEFNFVECEFENCDLSLAIVNGTSFKDAKFINCKILGLHFENCNKLFFSIICDGCNLSLSCFYQLRMKNTSFKDCILHEVDFTETILMGSVFFNCDLREATFDHSNLEKVDFRTAFNYQIDPEINNIRRARFSIPEVTGLLIKYDIDIEP